MDAWQEQDHLQGQNISAKIPFISGTDTLIATARSNKVAVCLGFQDFSQLTRDYDDMESKVIRNTVGNRSQLQTGEAA